MGTRGRRSVLEGAGGEARPGAFPPSARRGAEGSGSGHGGEGAQPQS